MNHREYLNTDATSELTGISKSTLEKARVYGHGIPFIKAGRSVRYALADVRAWMEARRVTSTSQETSEPGVGAVGGHR